MPLRSVARRFRPCGGMDLKGTIGTDTYSPNVSFTLKGAFRVLRRFLLVGAGWLRRNRCRSGSRALRGPGSPSTDERMLDGRHAGVGCIHP